MKPAAKPWPVVIVRLVEAVVAAAKEQGVRATVTVFETESSADAAYAVCLRVPVSETVMTRATKG